MALTSIDIDRDKLKQAKQLTGTASNRETVALALRTLIGVRRQPAAVERIISRRFEPSQIDAPTDTPSAAALPSMPAEGSTASSRNALPDDIRGRWTPPPGWGEDLPDTSR